MVCVQEECEGVATGTSSATAGEMYCTDPTRLPCIISREKKITLMEAHQLTLMLLVCNLANVK